jgi:hypothetical protein
MQVLTLKEGFRTIGIGSWLGLIMLFNVWVLIWPNQKKILGFVSATDEEKNKARRVAFLASRTNTMLSIPMLFFMVASGGIFNYPKREVPDQMTAIVEYPGAFTLTLTSTATNGHNFPPLLIMGTEGTLEYYGTRLVYHSEPVLENYTYSTNHFSAAAKQKFAELHDVDPTSMRPRSTASLTRPEPQVIDTPGTESTERHLQKFFESVRTRTEPTENAAAGHRYATVGHMVNVSYRAQKPAIWNAAKGIVEV